jgi:hypothetical protein
MGKPPRDPNDPEKGFAKRERERSPYNLRQEHTSWADYVQNRDKKVETLTPEQTENLRDAKEKANVFDEYAKQPERGQEQNQEQTQTTEKDNEVFRDYAPQKDDKSAGQEQGGEEQKQDKNSKEFDFGEYTDKGNSGKGQEQNKEQEHDHDER